MFKIQHSKFPAEQIDKCDDGEGQHLRDGYGKPQAGCADEARQEYKARHHEYHTAQQHIENRESGLFTALIIADKTDVRRSRVRNRSQAYFDIHDRVNYSVTASKVHITAEEIRLTLTIDTANSTLMEYFEIFLGRMMLCKKAAEALNVAFSLIINGQQMM